VRAGWPRLPPPRLRSASPSRERQDLERVGGQGPPHRGRRAGRGGGGVEPAVRRAPGDLRGRRARRRQRRRARRARHAAGVPAQPAPEARDRPRPGRALAHRVLWGSQAEGHRGARCRGARVHPHGGAAAQGAGRGAVRRAGGAWHSERQAAQGAGRDAVQFAAEPWRCEGQAAPSQVGGEHLGREGERGECPGVRFLRRRSGRVAVARGAPESRRGSGAETTRQGKSG
ncbi:unnamed protein product, partial [Prorocentrum cordatum]